MKLLDLLVKELPHRGGWPKGVDAVEQDCEGELFEKDSDYCSGFKLEKCDDWITDVVTKQQYESAISASKAVVGHDGWIQWSGGECPVDSDAIAEVKFRNPNRCKFNSLIAGDFDWEHDGVGGDIIAYRLQHPGFKSRANDERMEQDLNECIGQNVDPAWNGDGLPPVGTICEALMPALNNETWHWRTVKVVESGIPGAEKEVLAYDIENTKPAWTDEFRPLLTEAERARDEAIQSMASVIDYRNGCSPKPLAGWIYEAISAGTIPGIKLEDK